MKKMYFLLRLAALGALVAFTNSVRQGDEVLSIPGFSGTFPSKQYSGYYPVGGQKHLFFYFVTSEGTPSQDPVVLWLNGGPGCSSFDGWVYEHGPFSFNQDASVVTLNPYTWARNASMIYLDSPACVGLSYSDNPASECHTNDTQTAHDANLFLRQFFTDYSEFGANEFFVAGESYGGVYVPSVSQAVLHGNQHGQKPHINQKGYMVGNGVTDEEFDGNAFMPFVRGKSLIPEDLFQDAQTACGGNYWNATEGSQCEKLINHATDLVENVNIYDVADSCYKPPHTGLGKFPRRRDIGRSWPLFANVKPGHVPTWHELLNGVSDDPPCMSSVTAADFLNKPATRQAIHAVSVAKQKWEICVGDNSHWSYDHDKGSMIPIHKELVAAGYEALIFSGDHDMCVPHTGTEAWTRAVGTELGVEVAWRPWYSDSSPTTTSPQEPNQVAGYTVKYKGLTYATVRGSGHTVPEYKPIEALALFSRFIYHEHL